MNLLAHLNLLSWELEHGESRRARRTMCSFEKPSTPCVSLRAWLAQSMAASPPPSQPFLHSASYLSHSVHPPMSFLASLKALQTTSFSFALYSTGASLPWFITILQSQTCLSSPLTPQIQSCFPSTFLPHLTAPQLLLLLFAYFKSQQKSWLRTPGLINIDTTNIPSLGTDWHRWPPPDVGDKMILWRCLPLKQFLVNWKGNLNILLPKKLQMLPSKRNQPSALHISIVTPYKTYKTWACVMSNQYFSCEHGTNTLNR